MKIALFVALFTAFYVKSISQPSPAAGRLKITIESAKCINKSWDGFVEFDGHGNEISIGYGYRIYNPANPDASRSGAGGTVIFGSNVNGMTRAGTQTPDLGGINNGDVIPIGHVLMDEHINANDYILIAPAVWEWDGPEKNTINSFNAQLAMDLNWAIRQPFPFASTTVSTVDPFGDRVIKIFDKYQYGQALKYHNIFKNIFCPGNTQGNRVIGIRSGTFNNECLVTYPPTLLALDTRTLHGQHSNNSLVNSPYKNQRTSPVRGVNITFTENTYAVETSNGSYSVFFTIEFIPDPLVASSDASGLTGTPTRTALPVKKQIPSRNINITNTALNIPGTWSGTYGYGESNTPNPYSIKFHGDGTMQVVDNVGVVQARGTYVFTASNRNISGTYTYLVGDIFHFNGTLSDNVMNAQWWKGADRSYGGKMVLYKK